ncbi:hypothetical protein FG877_02195 [Enterococcus casseliflavus]|nr:hypothetical protein [Enterococcus casseliflavus]
MDIEKNWEKLLSGTRNNNDKDLIVKENIIDIDSIVKDLVLDADVDDDDIWNYIYYLEDNDYISFNEYISAHALKCSMY